MLSNVCVLLQGGESLVLTGGGLLLFTELEEVAPEQENTGWSGPLTSWFRKFDDDVVVLFLAA